LNGLKLESRIPKPEHYMADTYSQLLDATIQHLEDLKERGTRFVSISPELVEALNQPARRKPGSNADDAQPDERNAERIKSPAPALPIEPVKASAEAAAKAAAFADLRKRATACIKCAHLASSRKNVVFGVGNTDAELMFVGEAPGADEDQQAQPFVGRAGQLLTKIIETMGLQRDSVYIANILKCRPDTPGQAYGNRKPTLEEMQTCIPFLHEQIDLIKPKVLVALGGTAVEGLLGKTAGIMKVRGNWQIYRGTPLMPTFHPAYLLRTPGDKRLVWEDMLQVMERLDLTISEKQRNFFSKA
jgi:uracil-DNA glycosylase family 4